MGIVNEIPLPGIDVRYKLVSDDSARLGVVHHRSESMSWCSSSVRIQTCRTTSSDAEEAARSLSYWACSSWRRTPNLNAAASIRREPAPSVMYSRRQ